MKKKNKKLNLIWIIPEIIGGIGIMISSCIHLSNQVIETIGLMEWVFQIALVILVLEVGIKGFGKGCDELKKIK